MAVRSPAAFMRALVLAATLVACGSPTSPAGSGVAPSGTAGPNGSAPVGSGGPSGGIVAGGLIDQGTFASLVELAAFENGLVDEVAVAAGLPTHLGAETWAWANQVMHDVIAERGNSIAFSGPGAQTAALTTPSNAGPPRTAVEGGGGVGVAMAAGLILSGVGESGGALRNFDIDLATTQETTENGERTVATVSGRIALTTSGSELSADVQIGVDAAVFDAATGAPIRTGSFHSGGKIKLGFCPDSDGKIIGRVEMTLSGGTSDAGTGSLEINAEVTGTVGEDAYLQTIDTVGSSTSVTTGPGGGPTQRLVTTGGYTGFGVDHAGNLNAQGATGGYNMVAEEGSLTQADADAAAKRIDQAAGAAVWVLGGKAQGKWRGGDCVEIRATERSRGVRKNELVQFEARPWHKIEARELAKKIVPEFAGVASLDPVDIAVASPVLLSFKAGPNEDDVGTITLTSTSNRGIGKLTIVFTVEGGWFIDGTRAGAFGSGTSHGLKCGDPPGEWVVEGTYSQGGFDGTQTWTFTIGADGRTGTFVYGSTAQGTFGEVIVFQTGVATGRVTLTILSDGKAHMDIVEEERGFFSFTNLGGQGSDIPLPPRVYPGGLDWDPGGDC